MTTRLRAALLSLLLAAGCSVSTDELKPKTAEECAATSEKACGYRCVGWNDPATGCAATTCAPCPAGPAGEPAVCNAAGACTYVPVTGCPGTLADCDGVGDCETDLSTDARHCGACGHGCFAGYPCGGGICQAQPLVGSTTAPRDVDCGPNGWLYWLDGDGYLRGGNVLALYDDPVTTLPPFPGAWRLAGDNVSSFEYVAGSDGVLDYIWEVDLTKGLAAVAASEENLAITGVSSNGDHVYWTVGNGAWLQWFDVGYGGATTTPGYAPIAQSGRDVAAVMGGAYFLDGRDVGVIDETYWDPYLLRAGPHDATRIAVGLDAYGEVVVYTADEDTGQIYGLPKDGPVFLVWEGAGPTYIDIAADGEGVYWTDWATATVRAYRNDGARYTLATADTPGGICIGPGSGMVSFTDAGLDTSGIYSVPK